MELRIMDTRILDLLNPDAPLLKLGEGYNFTEGPVFAEDAVYFTDFREDRIYCYVSGAVRLVTDRSCRTVGMTRLQDGRILGCATNLHGIADTADFSVIVDNFGGVRLNGTNDIVEDSAGRLFFTDPATRAIEGEHLGHSGVYCYDQGKLTLLDKTLPWPNGLAFTPDEAYLYIIDSRELAVYRRDMKTGALSKFIAFSADLGPGLPDGMRVDREGNLFIAGPGGVSVVAPDGSYLGLIVMPEIAANLCFDRTGLFITASTGIYHVDLRNPQ